MNKVLGILLLTAAAASPVVAQQAPAPIRIEQIAARVNGDIILKSDIDREVDLMRYEKMQQGLDPAQAARELEADSKDVLRNLIDKALLNQIAKEAGLSVELDVQKTMEELRVDKKFATMEDLEKAIIKDYGDVDEFKNDIRTKFLTQQVIDHEVIGRIIITQEEMRKYYDANQKEFDKPAGVRVAEITVLVDRRLPDQVATQRKKAEEALAAVKKGDNFAEVAEKFSEVSTAEKGGDIGFIAGDLKEQVNEDVAKALEGLQKNQNTDIVEFNDAFTIFKITDKHNGGVLSYELAQNFIWNTLMSKIAPEKIRDYLKKLREDGFVDVKPPFVDTGAVDKSKKSASTAP
jgi:peptidyl-prolyl cis-trans isomerase SurA